MLHTTHAHLAQAGTMAPTRCLPRHMLCFEPLLDIASRVRFPCNARGEVALDALSYLDRINYLFARATVGRRYARPVVLAAAT